MEKMKNVRRIRPRFRRTQLAVMAAVLTIAVRALSSATCHNPSVRPQSPPSASAGLVVNGGRAHDRSRGTQAQGDKVAKGSKAVTNASVMWGSFAPQRSDGAGDCKSPAPPTLGVAVPGTDPAVWGRQHAAW